MLFFFCLTIAHAGQAQLAWNASTSAGVGGYRLYYGTSSGNYTANVNVGNVTTYTVSGLTAGTKYYFAAKAYDTAQTTESGFSNEVSTTIPTAPLAGFSATPTSGKMPLAVTFSSAASTGTITGWSWNFGDGTTSTAQNPSKTYANSGVYTVTLTATGPAGTNTATKTNYISVAPAASFTASPTSGTAPLPVTLTDTSTGSVTSRSWSFSDGTTYTTQQVAKTFNAAGNYTATLTVTGTGGSSTATQTIAVVAAPPTASFTASPTAGVAPLTTTFSNTSTGPITGWSWNFGDGTSSTAQNPSKTYASSGVYTVTLTATGPGGTNTATKTNYISVAPTAGFSATPTSGTMPLAVTFSSAASTGPITGWSWNFGDGTTSTAQNPAKTYANSGVYTVTLTVTGPGGTNTATKTNYISVAPAASFTASPTSGTAPLLVTLTDTSTGSVTSRSWTFSDGTTDTAQQVVKTFNAVGDYTATLKVTGSGGSTTAIQTISATAVPPAASFTASPTAGVAPLTTTFSNTSTGTILSYQWNFGDNTTSTELNPSHTYTNPGTYNVTLTATGPTGTTPSTTSPQTITVTAASANTSGLVAAYNFEEAGGMTVVDAAGQRNHGTIAGASRTSSGKYGKGLSFDGVNDWVTVNDSVSLGLTNQMTLEAWVYPTATMSSWRSVLLKEQASGLAYALYANSSANQPAARIYIGGDQNLPGGSVLAVNTWTHLTATYDGTTERLYINGNQVASKPQAGNITVSSGVLRIGGNSLWNEFFKGRIDEVRLYNRALSATEIQTDMQTAVATSSPPKPLLGEEVNGAVADSLVPGTAAAFQTTASVTGQVTSLPVYVETDSASTKLIAGIYRDNNGHPGTLLGQGTLNKPVAGNWNRVPLPAIAVDAGTTYWVAILSSNGILKFRDKVSSTARPSETSGATTLTTLPTTWTTGTVSGNGPLSGYGAGY